jgi:Ca-activated chloride channel family protein
LLDAVYLGVAKLRNAQYQRHALIIISDGGDNSSRYSLKEIKNLVAESDVMVYAIGLFDSGPFKSFEEVMGKQWLSTMTDITGGRTVTVDSLEKLPEASARLSRELRSQYVLGYQSSDKAEDGKWRKIKVVVAQSADGDRLRSYHKKGYYASTP